MINNKRQDVPNEGTDVHTFLSYIADMQVYV